MADAITTAREAIEGRIREIEQEAARLKRALAALVEDNSSGRRPRQRSSGARSSPTTHRRKLAPRGRRREQLLAHLEKNPGARPSEIAKAIGTTPANVQNVLRKAREDKVVRRDKGGGYALSTTGERASKKRAPSNAG